MKEIIVPNLKYLSQAAEKLLALLNVDKRVFLFDAPMGAGKTTFIKALCRELGVEENVSSPTFSIINEYHSPIGPIYHFDFYRIKEEQEAYDMGYEEYFYSGSYCFVEWPQKISNILPEDALLIEIVISGPESRIIRFKD